MKIIMATTMASDAAAQLRCDDQRREEFLWEKMKVGEVGGWQQRK